MGSKLHTDAARRRKKKTRGRRRTGGQGIEMRVATRREGGQNMCVRGEVGAVAQRGSIFPIANFALRFSSPFFLFLCPTRTLSSPIHPISRRRRAPRFPRRTIHSSAPALFQPPLSPFLFSLLLPVTTFSLDLRPLASVSSALYNIQGERAQATKPVVPLQTQ